MSIEHDFERLRNEWALKANITESTIDMERRADQNANPYNDNYHNKRPRRDDAQIVSDRSYMFADGVLKHQYGNRYTTWLKQNTMADPHIPGLNRLTRQFSD